MYLENFEDTRDFRPQLAKPEGVASKKLDFPFYWRALKRKKWPITLFTGLATAAAIYYTQIAVPIYAATATLLLESQKANIISVEDLVSSEQESGDYIGTQYAILRSRALAERVVRHLELSENISQQQIVEILTPSATDPGTDAPVETRSREQDAEFAEILKQFRDSLRVNPVAKTKLVTITYESRDPEFSALAANTVATQYIESVLDQRQALRGEASQWMDTRITQLKAQLDESEAALLSFKQSNDLVDFNGDVGRLNEQELLLASSELAEANNDLSNARDLYRKIQNYKASSPELLETLPFVQSDILVRSVKTELGEAQRDLVELNNRYGARHPRIIDAQSRLESLRATLAGHIERTVATFESDYQLLQQRVASLQANVSQGRRNVQEIGQQKITLEALEREVSANREQYNKLFDRITEVRTTDGLDEANAVVAEAAWVPTDPIKPNKKLIIGLALVGSFLLAAAVSFLVEFMDDTVNSTDDIERRLRTKLLGVFPLIKSGFLKKQKTLPLTPSDVLATSEAFSEAVNTCRTALSVSDERNLQVILVTSSVPDEGKSTVALNLANSFGQLERTILLDCDLRRPSIAKAIGVDMEDEGISSLLLQESTFQQCLRRDVLDSFDCLTSGPVPEQPLEMLSSARFAKILEILRQHYDKIIIDSAPTQVVSDALVLSRLSDGVLYVVKPHKTSIKLVDKGLTRIAEARGSVLGVCISQADIEKSRSHGGLEFHGFGSKYLGYGSYYRYGGKPNLHLRAKMRADEMKVIRAVPNQSHG